MPAVPPSTTESRIWHIPNRRDEIDRAEDALLTALEKHGYPDSARFAVRLAVEEALSNAFHHGHKNLAESTPVRFEYHVGPAQVKLEIEDQGPGFKPEGVPDPTLEENLELPSGRGLLLMRAYMAEVEYNARGNGVRMLYKRPVG